MQGEGPGCISSAALLLDVSPCLPEPLGLTLGTVHPLGKHVTGFAW